MAYSRDVRGDVTNRFYKNKTRDAFGNDASLFMLCVKFVPNSAIYKENIL